MASAPNPTTAHNASTEASTATPGNTRSSAAPAHFGFRLIAAVYDLLPVLALWFVGVVLALCVTGGALDVHRLGDKLLVQAFVLGLTALYFIASWLRGGQTVGMRAWRLRVVTAAGVQIDFKHALLRFAVAVLSLAALGLGFLWCLIDRDRRAWHDMAAGTLVVRMEKRDKGRG
jgi:uncharacterized RDD family membrane protein YckC